MYKGETLQKQNKILLNKNIIQKNNRQLYYPQLCNFPSPLCQLSSVLYLKLVIRRQAIRIFQQATGQNTPHRQHTYLVYILLLNTRQDSHSRSPPSSWTDARPTASNPQHRPDPTQQATGIDNCSCFCNILIQVTYLSQSYTHTTCQLPIPLVKMRSQTMYTFHTISL